ncbi:site-specific integrase [Alteromonas aestuariivivens]|uniref:Site-specific integrase n=1 Tax=Alteromonas aestuariivivens TaxID=1938339 RepID=A0A3D8M363_9ALTE|nr:site-specific integrase [Alteromonas aestuariivivens]
MNWLSDYDKDNGTSRLATHNNLPAEFINKEYIDNHLCIVMGAGKAAITHHEAALQHYYNYLCAARLSKYKQIHHSPKLNTAIEKNTKARTALKYLSKSLRLFIYENATSLRDEILLRNGGELGLRTRENLGLLLNDFDFGGKKEQGLKSLWLEMQANKEKRSFRYLLQGQYTKGAQGRGGKSREIFIPRHLLQMYKRYFERERPTTIANRLLVNNAANANGTPIKTNKGSDVFARLRDVAMEKQYNGSEAADIQMLEAGHTYHCLRHSFATDKFVQFCNEDGTPIEEASSDSRAFLRVARLMGHSLNAKTTASYIQLALDKQSIEKKVE